MPQEFKRPYCTCKLENEFCDICLQVALDEFVRQGKLERVVVNGEYAYVNPRVTVQEKSN